MAARPIEFYAIYCPKSGQKQHLPLKRLILRIILQFPQKSESSVLMFQIGVKINQAAQINKH
jgi:hypothetical protein